MSESYAYKVKVNRVVDGDTFMASIDLGFRIFHEMPLRIWGVNTPERGQPGYKEATQALTEYLGLDLDNNVFPMVTVITVKPKEKYGRWLAKVILPDGSFVHTKLIEKGFGIPYQE
jgi:micrococcal nuclease